MQLEQERPSDAEFDQMIARSREQLLQSIREGARPWWRRMSRFTVIASIVVAGGVAGGAYAATQALFPPPPAVIAGGDSVVHLEKPAPGDKWLNVGVAYTCKPGEHFTLKSGDDVIFDEDCDAMYYNANEGLPDGRAPRGLSTSIPIADVESQTLTMDSSLTRDYRIKATFGPIKVLQQIPLPGRGTDGKVDWATPDYEVNEYGLTVGPLRMNIPEGQEPDLIPIDFEGGVGYLLGKEYAGGDSPVGDDYLKYLDEQRRQGLLDDKGNHYAKVYAADGKTVLGKILTGTSSEK